MAEHAAAERKIAAPAGAREVDAARGAGPRAELLNRHTEARVAEPTRLLDRRAETRAAAAPAPTQPSPPEPAPRRNLTGLPDRLKAGVEALSGLSMDDVRVHRNSAQPAKLGALAYARGSDIHLGPGQERHLPHEAWHLVQQKQGRVRATGALRTGVAVNDDRRLEHEADLMADRIKLGGAPLQALRPAGASALVAQCYWLRMDGEVMWADNEPGDGMMQTNDRHEEADGHAAGPIYVIAEAAEHDAGEDGGDDADQAPAELDGEAGWDYDGTLIGVKDAAEDMPPTLEGPRRAWSVDDFFGLGLEDEVTDALLERPVHPATHFSFWCKVGAIDVKIHLTAARYTVIYNAAGRPDQQAAEATKDGLTGRHLYQAFLDIANAAGDYEPMRNSCETFAQNMYDSFTVAAADAAQAPAEDFM